MYTALSDMWSDQGGRKPDQPSILVSDLHRMNFSFIIIKTSVFIYVKPETNPAHCPYVPKRTLCTRDYTG